MIDEKDSKEYEMNHLYLNYLKDETNNSMDDLEPDCPEIAKQQYQERLNFIKTCNEKGIPIPEDL